jgi:hypothetical protein
MTSQAKVHVEERIQERSDEAWGYEYLVRNQNYVVMSMIESRDPLPCAVKIFGVFGSLAEANKASSAISQENDFFNVYVAETNAWLPIPPTAEYIENVEYQEQKMTEIKKSFVAMKERNAINLKKNIEASVEKK